MGRRLLVQRTQSSRPPSTTNVDCLGIIGTLYRYRYMLRLLLATAGAYFDKITDVVVILQYIQDTFWAGLMITFTMLVPLSLCIFFVLRGAQGHMSFREVVFHVALSLLQLEPLYAALDVVRRGDLSAAAFKKTDYIPGTDSFRTVPVYFLSLSKALMESLPSAILQAYILLLDPQLVTPALVVSLLASWGSITLSLSGYRCENTKYGRFGALIRRDEFVGQLVLFFFSGVEVACRITAFAMFGVAIKGTIYPAFLCMFALNCFLLACCTALFSTDAPPAHASPAEAAAWTAKPPGRGWIVIAVANLFVFYASKSRSARLETARRRCMAFVMLLAVAACFGLPLLRDTTPGTQFLAARLMRGNVTLGVCPAGVSSHWTYRCVSTRGTIMLLPGYSANGLPDNSSVVAALDAAVAAARTYEEVLETGVGNVTAAAATAASTAAVAFGDCALSPRTGTPHHMFCFPGWVRQTAMALLSLLLLSYASLELFFFPVPRERTELSSVLRGVTPVPLPPWCQPIVVFDEEEEEEEAELWAEEEEVTGSGSDDSASEEEKGGSSIRPPSSAHAPFGLDVDAAAVTAATDARASAADGDKQLLRLFESSRQILGEGGGGSSGDGGLTPLRRPSTFRKYCAGEDSATAGGGGGGSSSTGASAAVESSSQPRSGEQAKGSGGGDDGSDGARGSDGGSDGGGGSAPSAVADWKLRRDSSVLRLFESGCDEDAGGGEEQEGGSGATAAAASSASARPLSVVMEEGLAGEGADETGSNNNSFSSGDGSSGEGSDSGGNGRGNSIRQQRRVRNVRQLRRSLQWFDSDMKLRSDCGMSYLYLQELQELMRSTPQLRHFFNESGHLPLHEAVVLGLPVDAVRCIIAGDHNMLRLMTQDGDTPLALAIKHGHRHLIPLLLGAQNLRGSRAIPSAASGRSSSHYSLSSLLARVCCCFSWDEKQLREALGLHVGQEKLMWQLAEAEDKRHMLPLHLLLYNPLSYTPQVCALIARAYSAAATIPNPQMRSHNAMRTSHAEEITAVCFLAAPALCITAGQDRQLMIWKVGSPFPSAVHCLPQPATRLILFPDQTRLVVLCCDTAMCEVRSVADDLAVVCELRGHTDAVTCAAVLPCGMRLITGSRDKSIRLWSADTGQCLASLRRHRSAISALVCLPIRSLLQPPTTPPQTPSPPAVAGSSEGVFISADMSGSIKIWDLSQGSTSPVCNCSSHAQPRSDSDAQPQQLAALPLGHLQLKQQQQRHSMRSASIHSRPVKQQLRRKDPVNCMLLRWHRKLPRKRYLVTGHPSDVKLWSLDSLFSAPRIRPPFVLSHLRGHTSAVTQMALLPDGDRLMSLSENHTVKMWSVENRICISTQESTTSFRPTALAPVQSACAVVCAGHDSYTDCNVVQIWGDVRPESLHLAGTSRGGSVSRDSSAVRHVTRSSARRPTHDTKHPPVAAVGGAVAASAAAVAEVELQVMSAVAQKQSVASNLAPATSLSTACVATPATGFDEESPATRSSSSAQR